MPSSKCLPAAWPWHLFCSSKHLVNDRSGFVVPAGNVEELALALSRFTHLADDTRQAMSAASFELSLQYTPARWADYVYTRTSEMLNKSR